ncbi:MAG: SDR family NAD(P)-dependent oxidoreductase [Chloroflexi bacterium]|nr:SDR family NAD(P)-dependent oxidoreductase [Chloroflexota bacterium]
MQLLRRLATIGALSGGGYWFWRYLRPRHSTLVLEDKVALITGASSLLGKALATGLARRGARVILVAQDASALDVLRRELEPITSDVLVIPADITDEQQLQGVVRQALEHFDRIDVLVNNANLMPVGQLHDQDPAQIEHALRLNLWSVIRLTQAVLPQMAAQHQGYILNLGSGLGRVAAPLFSSYVASKYGLVGFTDALRREVEGTGIYLTLVLAGWTQGDPVTPEIEELIRQRSFLVEPPDVVAERAILGLVNGENEIVMGGALAKLGVWAERVVPLAVRLYWRWNLTPHWVAGMSKLQSER